MAYEIRWSEEAVNNLAEILDYLEHKWTEKEVQKFKSKLNHQLDLISQSPFIFPSANFNPEMRKAVLSKQTTIFYKVIDATIFLAYIHVNMKDIERLR